MVDQREHTMVVHLADQSADQKADPLAAEMVEKKVGQKAE
jgi:hypothetical protein